jgi:hypothetical protein
MRVFAVFAKFRIVVLIIWQSLAQKAMAQHEAHFA